MKIAENLRDLRRERHQFAADAFRQRAEQFVDERFAQAGHGPLDAGLRNGLRETEAEFHRCAVMLVAGRVSVAHRHRLAAERHGIGKRRAVKIHFRAASQIRFGGAKEFRPAAVAKEAIEFVHGRNILDALRVKREQLVVQTAEVVPPDACLPILDFLANLMIVFQKGVLRRQRNFFIGRPQNPGFIFVLVLILAFSSRRQQIIFHERGTDENFRGFRRIHIAVRDFNLAHFQAVKRSAFLHQHIAGGDAPLWILMRRLA